MFQEKFHLWIIIFTFISVMSSAQDFDIYPRLQDDKIKTPGINANMTADEFSLLSRNIRMMDMPYSLIVPGYIHFKAKDNTVGYTLLGLRIAGYTGLAINAYRLIIFDKRAENIITGKNNLKQDQNLFITSSILILGSWLFDWIHGKYRLEKKQELIRYKYGIKLQLEKSQRNYSQKNYVPSLMLTYKF
ncbi:MAG TPA: hypothetical protein VJ937_01715 [Salinivirga sp.]|uniref:hypothetical protein n=1 Tax=Salinivirga sp. TaxID=1970192 RepID=UPI002B49D13C|nr:hypothetical protein [Salinivirga sp.]HKK58170.1 hypothetical protein [Salinivirga sp.]